MKSESIGLKEILIAKEKRATIQRELINMYRSTLVSFTLNIPGANKNNQDFTKIHQLGIGLLEEELNKQNIKVLNKIVSITAAGAQAFINIDEDAMAIKKITVDIEEEHKLGRLFDFDVFNCIGELLSRTQMGFPKRKCLLCDKNAKVCARSRKHSIDDLLNKIYLLISECKL